VAANPDQQSDRRQTSTYERRRSDPASVDGGEDYYVLLGVPPTATAAQLTRAYRAAMKRVHPDRHQPAQRQAAEIRARLLNQAYATLSKPLSRQAYDQTIRARLVQDQIMSRYVGGLNVPPANGHDPFARQPRREPTAAEKREQARADRNAVISILLVFGGVTLGLIGLLVLVSLIGELVNLVF
jgi:diphthamide biosynthesis protein 4